MVKQKEERKQKLVIEVSNAEFQLLKTIREIQDLDEMVRICSGLEAGSLKNCLLFVASEKIL
ncbi:hypothetical protein [Neobacillus sp.]|uniref:hypothetical protein n=1 Tax=Neobacillus sp. TaxID=2675273 RepID=UPI0035B56F10